MAAPTRAKNNKESEGGEKEKEEEEDIDGAAEKLTEGQWHLLERVVERLLAQPPIELRSALLRCAHQDEDTIGAPDAASSQSQAAAGVPSALQAQHAQHNSKGGSPIADRCGASSIRVTVRRLDASSIMLPGDTAERRVLFVGDSAITALYRY